jgi:hypothetical protein
MNIETRAVLIAFFPYGFCGPVGTFAPKGPGLSNTLIARLGKSTEFHPRTFFDT